MVNIEHLVGGFTAIVTYPFFAQLLTDVLDAQAPFIPGGLTRFFIFLVVPVLGIRILYVIAKGAKEDFRR